MAFTSTAGRWAGARLTTRPSALATKLGQACRARLLLALTAKKLVAVMLQDLRHQGDALGRWHIGQADESAMRGSRNEQKVAEILVDRDHHPAFGHTPLEEGGIAWVWAVVPYLVHVVPLLAQPLRQASPGAAVQQELHPPATCTASRESWAITVCA